MILILVLSTHLAFRSRPVFVVVTGLHFIKDSFKDIYFVHHNISLRIKKGKLRTGSLEVGFSIRNKLSLQSGAVHKYLSNFGGKHKILNYFGTELKWYHHSAIIKKLILNFKKQ